MPASVNAPMIAAPTLAIVISRLMFISRLMRTACQALRAIGQPAAISAPIEARSTSQCCTPKSSSNSKPGRISSAPSSAKRVSSRPHMNLRKSAGREAPWTSGPDRGSATS